MLNLEVLTDEPPSVQHLIKDRPERWNYLLASEIIKVRMDDVNSRYAELADAGSQAHRTHWGIDDFLTWVESTTKNFDTVTYQLEKLLGTEVKIAVGLAEAEADALALQVVANRIKSLCEDLLVWDRDARDMAPPQGFNGAVEIFLSWTNIFLDTINDFVQRWDHGFKQPLNEQGKLVVDIKISIHPPAHFGEVRGMVERHRSLVRSNLREAQTPNHHVQHFSDMGRVIEDLTSLSFTAIDFEIANPQRDSLCAIGVAQVQNGIVVKVWKQLVHPPELRVDEMNFAIHKISEADLESAPTFPEVWNEFQEMIADKVVVAHNAEFDMNVLHRTLELYGLEPPPFHSLCTMKLSHVAFPQLDDYRLADVCHFLDLKFTHHSCDDDARVCAEIAIQAIPRVSIKKLRLNEFDLTGSLAKTPSATKVTGKGAAYVNKRFDSDLLKPQLEGANPNHSFYNKRLVFTGDLDSMKRSEAAERVQALGADINTSISRKTQIVVVGRGAGPSKMRKIHDLHEQGVDIQIIDEDEFLQIIKG